MRDRKEERVWSETREKKKKNVTKVLMLREKKIKKKKTKKFKSKKTFRTIQNTNENTL